MSRSSIRPSRRFRLAIVGVLAVVAIGVAAVIASGGTSGSDSGVTRGAVLPDDVRFTLFDGTEATFADFRGRPLVINFWASWCPACVAEMPDFEAVHRELGDDVVFLGFDLQDTRADAEALVADTGVSYLLAEDPDGVIYQSFGGFAMPTTVFVDAEGTFVDRHDGVLPASDLKQRADALVSGP